MDIKDIISMVFIGGGLFFFFTGVVGLLRFPDIYTRMHALGKCDTLGLLLNVVGLAIYNSSSLTSIKILFIAVFILLTSPVVTHIIAKITYDSGIKPWQKDNS
jgi:multicomponent Na+:H+ antiporter subunit G